MKKTILSLLLMCATVFCYTAMAEVTLKIGDPAPKLDVMRWLKGNPVERFEPGHVYVVEFWATWCGPCIQGMSHMSKLARKYRGQAEFIAVSVRETHQISGYIELSGEVNKDEIEDAVREFVEDNGDRMDFTVAMDDPVSQKMFKNWMAASGVVSIPTTMIVDRQGRIAWVGGLPLSDERRARVWPTLDENTKLAFSMSVDDALPLVLDGTLNAAQAQAQLEAKGMGTEKKVRMTEILRPLHNATQQQNYPKLKAAVDKIVANYPNLRYHYFVIGSDLIARFHLNEADGFEYAEQIARDEVALQGFMFENAEQFWIYLSTRLAVQKGLSAHAYQFAVNHLQKAIENVDEVSALMAWRSLAIAYYSLGKLGDAIRAQKVAINKYEEAYKTKFDAYMFKKGLDPMLEQLARYKAEKAAGENLPE